MVNSLDIHTGEYASCVNHEQGTLDVVTWFFIILPILIGICCYLLDRERSGAYTPRRQREATQLSGEVVQLISTLQWRAVQSWIAFHSGEIRLLDKKKQSILHYACLFRAPAQVIETLLLQAPDLATLKNSDGELALHWAVRLAATCEVLESLLIANPRSGLLAKDNNGQTPLSILWDRHKHHFERHLCRGRDKLKALPSWTQVLYFLQVCDLAYVNRNKGFFPLHMASNLPCPTGLFRLLSKAHSEEAQQKDAFGDLPLSIACSNPVANRLSDGVSKIQVLLSVYPEAAYETNGKGRLPICVALESGISWQEGISSLFKIFPGSISIPDPVSGPFPFILAACGGKVQSDVHDEAENLSTIFQTLQANPFLV